MPKINVYLPDDLAAAVKDASIPVSSVCQQALEQAVRNMTAIHESTRSFGLGNLLNRYTARVQTVMNLATQAAQEHGHTSIGTEHILAGMIAEAENLAVKVLRSLDVDLDDLHGELQGILRSAAAAPRAPSKKGVVMSPRARRVLKLAQKEALHLGHNYIGTEHVLLGLLAESEGRAGQILRAMGVELVSTRRAVVAALTGYVHAQQDRAPAPPAPPPAPPTEIDRKLDAILARLDDLERRLPDGDAG